MLKFYRHDHHFKLYKSARADLNSETKKLVFLNFHCVALALASQKEIRQRLIILRVCNIFLVSYSQVRENRKLPKKKLITCNYVIINAN